MWSLVTIMRNCGIQLFPSTVKHAVAIPVNVTLCLLYMWNNCIITSTITYVAPGF